MNRSTKNHDVFDCQDLLLLILEYLGTDHLNMLNHVNKEFHRIIRKVISWSGLSTLRNYCSSLSLMRWATKEEGVHPNESTTVAAAEQGHLETLKWLVTTREPPCVLTVAALNGAALGGHLEVLQWIQFTQRGGTPWQWYMHTSNCAAKGGHIHVLQWLWSNDLPCNWNDTCVAAAEGGHLHVIMWLREQVPPPHWNSTVAFHAAKGGHLSMLQWIRAQNPPCPWQASACAAAVSGGHLEVLQWLRAQSPPCPWVAEQCWAAARVGAGGEAMQQFLRASLPPPLAEDAPPIHP